MDICVILRQGQKILVPCERNVMSVTLKGIKRRKKDRADVENGELCNNSQ